MDVNAFTTAMKRYHLYELADQTWCPNIIRQSIVESLRLSINSGGYYEETPAILRKSLKNTKENQIIDLCSGGGGPWESLHVDLNSGEGRYDVHLTDINPNHDVLTKLQNETNDSVKFCAKPVNALELPKELKGFRTLFSSFHHFEPHEAQQIIADAVSSRQGIAIFEFTRRNPLAILLTSLAIIFVPIFVLSMRPFSWSRLLFTYIVPIIPLGAAYDGTISCLRTYTESELREFTELFADQNYQWEIGNLKAGISPIPVTYLIGHPKETVKIPEYQVSTPVGEQETEASTV